MWEAKSIKDGRNYICIIHAVSEEEFLAIFERDYPEYRLTEYRRIK